MVRTVFWLALSSSILAGSEDVNPHKAATPKTWDDAAMRSLEVPLANPAASPKHVPAEYYYRIPVRPIYRQYPVYAPSREPAGYWEWLQKQEPVTLWDDMNHRPALAGDASWVKSGESVFDAPIFTGVDGPISVTEVRSERWYREGGIPTTTEGIVPFVSYVIREKGKVEVGSFACAMCHTRVMQDGSIIKGAQGNFPLERAGARSANYNTPPELSRMIRRLLYAVPWIKPDPLDEQLAMTPDQLFKIQQAVPPGVMSRHRSSPLYPVQVPDIIGVQDRKYLDRTGLQQHRSVVDMMRYAALNQGGDALADFDGFIPLGGPEFNKLPDPATPFVGGRYSDEQLYALAQFVYSLTPPVNPNKMDALATRGQEIFEAEGCSKCHVPPLYTNNKLTPAEGFNPPREAAANYSIAPKTVGTDPGLAMKTRRGTGYYKVPSLKGVWYRSMFGHSGWCATLEDWFDPKRVDEGYVPSGFKPNGNAPYPVKGHQFGLDLDENERKALIAFLKTL
jgi:hypothetical protein